jgi:hypothetical protein
MYSLSSVHFRIFLVRNSQSSNYSNNHSDMCIFVATNSVKGGGGHGTMLIVTIENVTSHYCFELYSVNMKSALLQNFFARTLNSGNQCDTNAVYYL